MKCKICNIHCVVSPRQDKPLAWFCCGTYYCDDCFIKRHNCHFEDKPMSKNIRSTKGLDNSTRENPSESVGKSPQKSQSIHERREVK